MIKLMNWSLSLICFSIIGTTDFVPQENCIPSSVDSLVLRDESKVFYKQKNIPRKIKQFLKSKNDNDKLKFVSIQASREKRRDSNRVLLFALCNKDENEWILFYRHGTRGIHRHLLHFKLDEKGHVCFYSNDYYIGKARDFTTLYNEAKVQTIRFESVDYERDL